MENESAPRRGYPWWGWVIAFLTIWPLVPMAVGSIIPQTRKYLGAPGVIIASVLLFIGCGVVVGVAPHFAENGGASEFSDAACLWDADCVVARYDWQAAANIRCAPYVESQSIYSFEWTDGFLERRFEAVVHQRTDGKSVRYFGGEIKFQNMYGAWRRMIYSCVYDPINERVLDVNVTPF